MAMIMVMIMGMIMATIMATIMVTIMVTIMALIMIMVTMVIYHTIRPYKTDMGTSANLTFEPALSVSYNNTSVPSEDSDHPAHLRSLITVFPGQSLGRQGSKASDRQRRMISLI